MRLRRTLRQNRGREVGNSVSHGGDERLRGELCRSGTERRVAEYETVFQNGTSVILLRAVR
jgi:hypothetical protein